MEKTTTGSAHQTAGSIIAERKEELADLVTRMQYEQQPDLMVRFGENGRRRTRQDTLYNLKYLSESIQMQSPLLFSSYISWLKTLLAGYKVTSEELAVNLRAMKEAIREIVDEEVYLIVQDYLDPAIRQVELPLGESPTFLEEGTPLHQEAELYTQMLLKGDRMAASELIMQLARTRTVEEIYLHIFQRSQYEIGRLWQTNQINVAQEHYCTAATQMIMSQLYPYIFATARKGRNLVAACVGEELHEIGLRMVSDFFEMEGWDTYYLGANVPKRSIIQSIIDKKADVMAISATMTFHVNLVKDLIQEIRSHEACRDTKIIVGGLPFNIDQELWRSVGADGFARDAKQAIASATGLIGAAG
ncbi:cobalamin-dependent protein [Paenibacillus aurantius]|uniref:Cobalamin-dependent protein n=1 Tax=Paenibacillus aurantius TaxID=2918900 RepID=A0AA96LIW8_9BACL|nr:cobalamin-dependent protein [Paenibacillus aurantius]WNQ12841.1 cobalamin-dependent protein [Paenibacillus aurantius]